MKRLFFAALSFVIITAGCKKNDNSATPEEKVVASFDISNVVSPGMIREGNVCDFKNNSTGAASYTWNFGNTTTSADALPSDVTFVPCGGEYTITLTAIGKSGQTATCSHSYTILCRGKMAHMQGRSLAPTHYSTGEMSNGNHLDN